ncbi:unnamed protein product [Vitrella brassicaformis CCMP3155]|uniref:aspartate kinase n=1 Tax=Vitrella brassicaformis (strain CCMP3155) TaxID=1169540 RepID=A0A0G4EQR9_VITBC|nr:unnamed protein product [Vitrella brassicaformis CCMP3155]|eukprot:CEM00573.1 unnamed protein product [Vitrella brassicaformis CCMP3155]
MKEVGRPLLQPHLLPLISPSPLCELSLRAKTTVIAMTTPDGFTLQSSPKLHSGPLVMKFGGSSVKDADRVRNVAEIVRGRLKQRPVVVLSAMGKTTNALIEAGRRALEEREVDTSVIQATHMRAAAELGLDTEFFKELQTFFDELTNLLQGIRLIREISLRTNDLLMSFGERLSVRMVAAYLNKEGITAKPVDSWDIGMLTTPGGGSATDDKGTAELLPGTCERIHDTMMSEVYPTYNYTPVVTGFIAKDKNGIITTLGRGGSDFTAAIIGCAIVAKEIEIWTDVDGILTADPRVVGPAACLPCISFEEASELAYFGAKVLHPMTILPATERGIAVRVKNSYNPHHPGTLIVRQPPTVADTAHDPSRIVTAVTYKKGVTVIDINSTRMLGAKGFLAKVFDIMDSVGICVDVIATSEVSISMTIEKGTSADKIDKMQQELDKIAHVTVEQNKAILTLIGNTLRANEIIATACNVFQKLGVVIDMLSCGASKVNVTFIVPDEKVEECVKHLHDLFFAKTMRTMSAPVIEPDWAQIKFDAINLNTNERAVSSDDSSVDNKEPNGL